MSEENVELSHRAADAFNRRDLDSFMALMDEDVEVVSRLAAMEGGYHGRTGGAEMVGWKVFLREQEALEVAGLRE